MLKNISEMDIINIETICVPIIVGIMSIAYPILGDKKNKIGEKYKADFLLNVFESFGPQKRALNNKFSYFEIWLLLTIISFIFLIISLPPLNIFRSCPIFYLLLSYSAKFITLVLTVGTVYQFVRWNNNIMIYTGKVTGILSKVLYKYENIADTDTQLKNYCLNTINSFTIYAIKNGEEHLQKTLLNFYYKEFRNVRLNTEKEKGEVVFPTELYFLIYNIIDSSLILNKQYLSVIEKRAVSGKWLFGEIGEASNISEETYMWLWRYIILMKEENRMLKSLWASSHQFLNYGMKIPYHNYSYEEDKYINDDEIDNVIKKRKRFKEVFIALGSLMLYQKNYSFIKYMFTFSQSTPPSYYLLPNSIKEILEWFDFILNDFENIEQPIEYRYWFPEYDNLGNSYQVKEEMCKYLGLLFIRQFSMMDYFSVDERNTFNIHESDISKLEFLLGKWSYFNSLILEHIENKKLLSDLGFTIEKEELSKLLDNIEQRINSNLSHIRRNAELSKEKLDLFYNSTRSIIVDAFKDYDVIQNNGNATDIDDNFSTQIEGGSSVITKSAFVDNDISHLNFNTSMALAIKNYNINSYIPNSFVIGATCNYVIESDKILKAIDKILPDLDNKIIVGMSVDWQTNAIIKGSRYNSIYHQVDNSSKVVYGSLFILDKKDLPYFEFVDLKEIFEKELEDNDIDISLIKLEKLSETFYLYAFVEDFNKGGYENIRKYYKLNVEDDELKVLISILFKCIIRWNKKRSVVQLNIVSEFMEQGIPNDISDIQPL